MIVPDRYVVPRLEKHAVWPTPTNAHPAGTVNGPQTFSRKLTGSPAVLCIVRITAERPGPREQVPEIAVVTNPAGTTPAHTVLACDGNTAPASRPANRGETLEPSTVELGENSTLVLTQRHAAKTIGFIRLMSTLHNASARKGLRCRAVIRPRRVDLMVCAHTTLRRAVL